MTLNKAAGKGQWREAFAAACDALKSNPWDTGTLLDVAEAYKQIGSDECQLFALRWALDAAPKDVTVNRRAAETLSRRGQFDQAISCWRRVEQAKPGDEEADKAISQLSVEKTIQQGGYNQELLHGAVADPSTIEATVRERSGTRVDPMRQVQVATKSKTDNGREQVLLDAIADPPGGTDKLCGTGRVVCGTRTACVRRRKCSHGHWLHQGAAICRFASGWKRPICGVLTSKCSWLSGVPNKTKRQNRLTWRAAWRRKPIRPSWRCMRLAAARNPGNLLLQYELGLRCKRAGKFKEAIQAFQAARDDARHKALVQLHLGESFQHIRQFRAGAIKLRGRNRSGRLHAARHEKTGSYRAGVLAAELGRSRQGREISDATGRNRFRLPRRGRPARQTGRVTR